MGRYEMFNTKYRNLLIRRKAQDYLRFMRCTEDSPYPGSLCKVEYDAKEKSLMIKTDSFAAKATVESRYRLRVQRVIADVVDLLVRAGICEIELVEDEKEKE